MSKVKIELNSAGVRELLNSAPIGEAVMTAAARVRNRAGDGYEVTPYKTSQRTAARIAAATDAAESENRKNNTLLHALG